MIYEIENTVATSDCYKAVREEFTRTMVQKRVDFCEMCDNNLNNKFKKINNLNFIGCRVYYRHTSQVLKWEPLGKSKEYCFHVSRGDIHSQC